MWQFVRVHFARVSGCNQTNVLPALCLHQAESASSGSKILHRMHSVFVHMASTGGDRAVAELVAQKNTVTHMPMSLFVLNICLFNFEVQEKQRKTVQLRVSN